jgi:hypothetical protein
MIWTAFHQKLAASTGKWLDSASIAITADSQT